MFDFPVFVEWLKSALVWILLIAAFDQQLVQYIKPLWQGLTQIWMGKPLQAWIDQAAALVLSLALCFLLQYNAFEAISGVILPFTLPPWAGVLATGILAGSGSDVIHKIIALLDVFKQAPSKP